MTTFHVYDDATKPEDKVYFRLIETSDGRITLQAVDENGRAQKSILSIRSDGSLVRYTVAHMPGIQTDDYSRIKLSE